MKINIQTIFNISKENEPLISVCARDLGYVDGDINEFIKTRLSEISDTNLRSLVIPVIIKYFGMKDEQVANNVIEQLQTAIMTNVTIEQD